VNIWEILLDLKPQSLPMELPPMSFCYSRGAEIWSINEKKRKKIYG
jgi:hypothetical protein